MEFIGENPLPYFKPLLPYRISIWREPGQSSWSYLLDPQDDDVGDVVTVEVDLGETAAFMSYTGDRTLEIENLFDEAIKENSEYVIKVIASDGRDTIVNDVIIEVVADETPVTKNALIAESESGEEIS